MTKQPVKADVCLFLEGTYPYISGGVSTWTHELIKAQPQFTFYLVCILAPHASTQKRFDIPSNVVGMHNVFLQKLPRLALPATTLIKQQFFTALEVPLLNLQHRATLKELKTILDLVAQFKPYLGEHFLLDSEEAWNMLQRMYLSTMGETSFLHYFWSWRSLLGSFYSVVLADLPAASIYHTFSTGYAGLFLARAYIETGRPCLITEHGIYTNERRIEVAAADWLADIKALNLNIERSRFDRDLKDYWIDSFAGYSKLCYAACAKILTIYEGNKEVQQTDGADPQKMEVIPNGIDEEYYAHIPKIPHAQPIVALIGRVVPIKDVKTFIRAIAILKQRLPSIQAWIIGPTDEDKEYYCECVELVQANHLEETLTFTGKVNLEKYLGQIDVLVLTSISEAQPLVLLEAGAVGIPCVATDVGACREILQGRKDEMPPIGASGSISKLANPESVADHIYELLVNPVLYQACSRNARERVKKYYNKADWQRAYQNVYTSLLKE